MPWPACNTCEGFFPLPTLCAIFFPPHMKGRRKFWMIFFFTSHCQRYNGGKDLWSTGDQAVTFYASGGWEADWLALFCLRPGRAFFLHSTLSTIHRWTGRKLPYTKLEVSFGGYYTEALGIEKFNGSSLPLCVWIRMSCQVTLVARANLVSVKPFNGINRVHFAATHGATCVGIRRYLW